MFQSLFIQSRWNGRFTIKIKYEYIPSNAVGMAILTLSFVIIFGVRTFTHAIRSVPDIGASSTVAVALWKIKTQR